MPSAFPFVAPTAIGVNAVLYERSIEGILLPAHTPRDDLLWRLNGHQAHTDGCKCCS